MIVPLLTLAAAAAAPALGTIGRQQLPAHGCAAFLWPNYATLSARGVAAMVGADPAILRVALDGGAATDLPRVALQGVTTLGLPSDATYRGAGVTAALTMAIVPRADLRDGAGVPQATLRVMRDGGDERVVPLAGLIGCRVAS